MEEDMKKRLLECGKGLLDWAQQAGEFVKDQAPLVVQEFLAWTFWEAALLCVLGIVLAAVGAFCIRKWGKAWLHEDPGGEIPLALNSVLIVAGFIVLCCNVPTLVKVKVAPRLVVIEKIRELVK